MSSLSLRRLALCLIAGSTCLPAASQTLEAPAARIVHDGRFEDWAAIAPVATDPDDQPAGAVDLLALAVTNDEQFLRLRIAFADVTQLQENNDLVLHIDTDADATTGQPVAGIGADLSFAFGSRSGTVVVDGSAIAVQHTPLRLSWAPTFSAPEFEVEIALDAVVGGAPVFPGDPIRVALTTSTGERLPQADGGAAYTLDRTTALPDFDGPTLDRSPEAVRVVSYNVLRDNIFAGAAREAFFRLVHAIGPDVVAFQEIYDHSGAEAAALVAEALGGTWYSGDAGSDNLLVSRWPVTQSRDLGGNSAFLVQRPGDWAHDLLVVNAHTPCCTNEDGRLDETDRYMQFVRQVKEGSIPGIAPDTPFAIVGDLNMVGTDRPLRTMLTGDLVDNARYGPDFAPDLDGTDLTDALPLHLGAPAAFTWYSASSSFPAGRLDFIVYTDSALEMDNAFVLYTPHLSDEALAEAGLLASDTDTASDHLPLAADLVSTRSTSVAQQAPEQVTVRVAPNPFSDRTVVSIDQPRPGTVTIEVYDVLGRRVAIPFDGRLAAGPQQVPVDASALAPGVYLYRVRTADGVAGGTLVRR